MANKKVYGDGWLSEPEAEDRSHEFKILRTPPKGLRGLRVLSHEPLGRYTHHWKGRTTPCADEDCKACKDGNMRRWYGWVFVLAVKTEEIYCFEYTKAAASTFKRYFSRNRTLIGAHLASYRKERRPNGELGVELTTPAAGGKELPKAPCRKKFLSRLWETNIKINNREPQFPKGEKDEDRENVDSKEPITLEIKRA